jgi:hypothetical protein
MMLARPAITRTVRKPVQVRRPGNPHTRGTARPRKADVSGAAESGFGCVVRVDVGCSGGFGAVAVVADLPGFLPCYL